MEKLSYTIINKIQLSKLVITFIAALMMTLGAAYVLAAGTSNFTQTITAGTLSIDIVDGAYSPVASPSVAMNSTAFSFSCQTATGTFGTAGEQIYVQNPDASDNGWAVSLAAAATTDTWASTSPDFDFNDPTTAGCADSADADTFAGQMTVDASVGNLDVGDCSSCTVTDVSQGSSAAFVEGGPDSITILTGASTSDDIGDWTLEGVSISQTIPAEQAANTDYNINMVLSILAT